MGEPLICPTCKDGCMKWENPDLDDLLDDGVMYCPNCGAFFLGMGGWIKAMEGKNNGVQSCT